MIIPPEKRNVAMYLLIALIFLVMSISVGGNIYLSAKTAAIKKDTQESLYSIAYLKVARIKTWWEERMGDAAVIFSNKPMILLIRQFLEGNASDRNSDTAKEILLYLDAVKNSANYEDVMILDANGGVRLALNSGSDKICSLPLQIAREAIAGKRIMATDIYRCDINSSINIDILIPLFPTQSGDSAPIGLMLLRINPNQFLYPLVQYWPSPSATAESLLVRREGDYVLYLNELRHRKGTMLSLKLPLSSKDLTAAMAAKGREGVVEGRDYRGAKVISVIQKVPGTPWYLLAKIDEKEAYYPVRHEVFRVSLTAFLLVIISIIFVALVWNQQVTRFYRIRYEMENKRIKVEDDLRKANEEWERTFNAVSDSLFILDMDHRVLKGNKAFFNMLGMKPEDVIGKNCYEVMHKMNKPWPGCPMENTKLDSRPHTEEVTDPEIGFSLLVSTSPIFDNKGNLIGAVHISTDISDRKKTEKELQEAKERLERTNKELRKLDQLKSDFISTVSHELRTPLAIIKEGINLILDKIPGEINKKQHSILEVSSHNIDRLARIINSLLDISKIESGKIELRKVFFKLPELIKQIASPFEGIAKQKGLELRLDVEKAEGKVYADSDRIAQVITNLLDNAIKFTDKGHIEISCRDKNEMLECCVADTGKGISKEDLPKVFDKFQQFGRLAGPGERGTGLGLSIAKNIVEMHNGAISVESNAGAGSKFIFSLPKYTPEDIFKECINGAIKNAITNNLKVSIIMISAELSKSAGKEFAHTKHHDMHSEVLKIIKNTIHHKGDDVMRNDGEIMVILLDSNRQNCLKIKGRIEEVMNKYLSTQEMGDTVKMHFGWATYPDDATDATALMAKAKSDFSVSKNA